MNELWDQIQKQNPTVDLQKIKQAYEFAKKAHGDQKRKTGEPYITHPVEVVTKLLEHDFADTEMLCAALLHDVVEDTPSSIQAIQNTFGETIATIVEGLTKIEKHKVDFEKRDAENLRKILLASAKDSRVLIIKLADRLANLQSVGVFRKDKQKRIAENTMFVYAPLAEKIGLYSIKAELEDLSFKYIEPNFYDFIKRKITATKKEREDNTEHIIVYFSKLLDAHKIKYTMSGRAKHFYSIYKKMIKENRTVDSLYDLYGIRIIVESIDDCYKVHTILTEHYKALDGRFKDYIKNPKPNGYQSLHENVRVDDKIVEVQVRTRKMDYEAENGPSTHWKYKGVDRDKKFEKKISWLRQLLLWKKEKVTKHPEAHDIDLDIFRNEIIVVTPKGDPIILKEGCTPIDFAYSIHSAVGDHIKTAIVNGKIEQLNHRLASGDIVNIETSKTKTVTHSWLKMARSSNAQSKIRKALGIEAEATKAKRVSQAVKADLSNIYNTLQLFRQRTKKPVKVSKCCNPKPEDPVVAFYTKDKKTITVHKIDCPHQYSLNPKNKVKLSSQKSKKPTLFVIDVLVNEQPGVLVDVLNEVLHHQVQIVSIRSKEAKTALLLSLVITYNKQVNINTVEKEIRACKGVIDVKCEPVE